jgi:TrmH family RNA methyltransferase
LYTTQHDFEEVALSKKTIIQESDLKKNKCIKPQMLGSFKMPQEESITTTGLILALDTIRDPGNLGTILRLCDWFGVKQIYVLRRSYL